MRRTVLWAAVFSLFWGATLLDVPSVSAQNCSILTGGNPCTQGCPDECSPILCPGNALCSSRCGGSSCNVGCNPGPCGSGCRDECSTILCPQNHCRARCNAAPQCDLLCGGSPCGSGCPDQCSPIVCPGNALCSAQCGGSGCNIGCNPGPCGSGCPDECSVILCPQNHCTAQCNPVPQCDLSCGGNPCGSGCPDECSRLVCPSNQCNCANAGQACGIDPICCSGLVCSFPQFTCRHDPPEIGEPCSLFVPCREGLRCINLVCEEPRTLGEGCLVSSDCADGLDCRPCFVDGCIAPFMCFAQTDLQLDDEQTCRSLFSPALQDTAIGSGLTRSYGSGSATAVGVGASFEIGTVYGADGRYGCYLTTCLGGTIDVEIGSYISVGFYDSFDSFRGTSVVSMQEAGAILVFATAQIFDLMGRLIGTADCLNVEASLAPFTAGVFQCNTSVDEYAIETPTPTPTRRVIPSPTRTPYCPGDCDQDSSITIDELVLQVSIALGNSPPSDCPTVGGIVTVSDIVSAIRAALDGC